MITKIQHPGVLQLSMSNRISRAVGYSVSAYVTHGELVDCGPPSAEREMSSLLGELRPQAAWITHHHEDHAGNIELLARRGVPIGATAATLDYCRAPHALPFYRRITWKSPRPLSSAVMPATQGALELITSPGHCRDHNILWDADDATLFAGDLYLGVKVRVAHPDENPTLLSRSLRSAAALEPRRMFDAHRGLVERPVHQLLAKAQWIDETVGEITRRVDAGWTDAAIRDDVLGREQWSGYFSAGEYSRTAYVRAVRSSRESRR